MSQPHGSLAQCPCGHWGAAVEVGTPTTFRDRTFTITSQDNGDAHDVRFEWTEENRRSVATCQKFGITNR